MAINLEDRLSNVEKRLDAIENKEPSYEDNSVISYVLDTFNAKKFLYTLLNSQDKFKFTENFIYLALLLIFLSVIFWESSTTTAICIILGAMIVEFAVANISFFQKWFISDKKTEDFLRNLPNISPKQALVQLKRQNFSSKCMSYFIKSIKDHNYSPKLVIEIIRTQPLSSSNIDLLLTPEILSNVDEKVIIRLLIKYGDLLTNNNIDIIYKKYHENEKVMRYLCATSECCQFLMKKYPEDKQLADYYEKYQVKKVYNDIQLKIFSLYKYSIRFGTFIAMLIPAIFASIQLVNAMQYQYLYNTYQTSQVLGNFVGLFLTLLFFVGTLIVMFSQFIDDVGYKLYINRYMKKIESVK